MRERDSTRNDWGTSKHKIPLAKITLNRTTGHVSIQGEVVVRTCASGPLKYSKFQDIEPEVEEYMHKWLTKQTRRIDCEQSHNVKSMPK